MVDVVLDPAVPPIIENQGGGSGVTTISIDGGPELGTINISSPSSIGALSTDRNYLALGVCDNGCGTGNARRLALDSDEYLTFKLTDPGKTAQSIAVGLLGLDTSPVAVSITFKRSGAVLSSSIHSVSVSTTLPATPQLTDQTPSPPAVFDEVEIQPIGSSQFFVSSFRFCANSTSCN